MKSLISYLKNVRAEFAHLTWPKTRVAIAHTALIVLISIVIGLLIGLLDYAFTGVVSRFVGA